MASRIVRKRKRMGYATVPSLLHILACHKEGKLDFPLTPRKLATWDIPEWNWFILYHTLEDLEFIRDGYTTKVFDALAKAYQTDQDEYETILKEHLRYIYAEILNRVPDLAHASQGQLIDAFKGCDPPKQHRRMVTLFRGLARQAKLIVNDEEIVHQESSEQVTDTKFPSPPLNDVPLDLVEYKEMPEFSPSPKTNGVIHVHSDYSMVDELLTSFEELHQELSQSTEWTEVDRVRWEKFLKINHLLLGKALKLIERTEP